MIPQERIEQAAEQCAETYSDGTYEIEQSILLGFRNGVRFAESEMGQIAQEFAEWCTINTYNHDEAMEMDIQISEGSWIHCNSKSTCTTSDLFAKFMAERGQGE